MNSISRMKSALGEAFAQFLSFFSVSKQAERITSDRVRPSAASFNRHKVRRMMNFEWNSPSISYRVKR